MEFNLGKRPTKNKMYQVSTLQALVLGYSRGVVTAEELASHGNTGLGTFEDVNGEMIVVDGHVYKADNEGNVIEVPATEGVPFAAVADVQEDIAFEMDDIESIDQIKSVLGGVIDDDFGLNSMYVVRVDAHFDVVRARSEEGQHSHHIELSEILSKNQKDFEFHDESGTMVCLYFPDYMDGINAPGWHLHYVSDDRKHGGHVFDLAFKHASARRAKIQKIEIQLPFDIAFDTYALKSVNNDEVKKVEQASE